MFHNSKNMGFSNNVNIGMTQSEVNDVLLLNSDTVVTKELDRENQMLCI